MIDPAALARILLATGVTAAFASAVPAEGAWLLAKLAEAGILYLGLLSAIGVLGPALGGSVVAGLAGARHRAPPAPMDGCRPSV